MEYARGNWNTLGETGIRSGKLEYARDNINLAPDHWRLPSVFKTGSQAFCESMVPKPPRDAPTTATARLANTSALYLTRQPVNRIFKHAGDTIVVFRRRQQQALIRNDACL